MALDTTIYEKIELYLANEMSEQDRLAFEQEVNTNDELKETVALYQSLNEDYTQIETSKVGVSQLQDTLQEISPNYFREEKKAKVFSMKRTISIFAVAASLVFAFLLLKPMLFSDKDLFKSYYEEEGLSTQRSNGDSVTKAIELFNQKEYTQALNYLEPITTADNSLTDLQLAKGVCYLNLDQYDKANKVFETIATGQTMYKERAQWLKAMLLLKQEKKAECKAYLQKIDSNSSYYKKAQELMGKL
jgi:tetratricopeptide (TPR) repeat protein